MNTRGYFFYLFMIIGVIDLRAQYLVWESSFNAVSSGATSIFVTKDNSGNILSTGSFSGTVDFDPGPGTYTLTSGSSQDMFVTKLDASGNFIWAKQIGGGISMNNPLAITCDAAGNVLTTGYFTGSPDFDPGPGTYQLNQIGNHDIFVSKLDASGSFVWAVRFGGIIPDHGTGIATDILGNVYTTGYFAGSVDFDPGPASYSITGAGLEDVFVQKLDANSNFVWAKTMGGGSSDKGNAIALDASGNIYTTGYMMSSNADFDPSSSTFTLATLGYEDVFVSKLDNSGSFVWAKQIGGATTEVASAIALDGSANVFLTGYFIGTTDFDPGPGISTLTSTGNRDVFVCKLDINGNYNWAGGLGGSAGIDMGWSVSVDPTSDPIVAGYFQNTADFDPGPGSYNYTSNGSFDIFVTKLNGANGSLIQAFQIGGPNLDLAASVCADASGSVFLAGIFSGTVDFDPGSAVVNITAANSAVYVCKLSNLATGTNNASATAMFKVFPDPASTELNIEMEGNLSEMKVKIINTLGQAVLTSLNQKKLDISTLPNGLYILQVYGLENQMCYSKFLKE